MSKHKGTGEVKISKWRFKGERNLRKKKRRIREEQEERERRKRQRRREALGLDSPYNKRDSKKRKQKPRRKSLTSALV